MSSTSTPSQPLNLTTNTSIDSLKECLKVLQKLEVGVYDRNALHGMYDYDSFPTTQWREFFVGWCYKITDRCEFDLHRETVDIALYYFDKYVQCKKQSWDLDDKRMNYNKNNPIKGETRSWHPRVPFSSFDWDFNKESDIKDSLITVSFACFFIAIKAHEKFKRNFNIGVLVRISDGLCSREQIVAAEKDVMVTLNFRLSPPTTMSFLRHFLTLLIIKKGKNDILLREGGYNASPTILSSSCPSGRRHQPLSPPTTKKIVYVMALARFLCELSVYDAFFVEYQSSTIALASIMTAFEGVTTEEFPRIYRQRLVNNIFQICQMSCTSPEVIECRVKLRELFDARKQNRSPETLNCCGGNNDSSRSRSVDNNTHISRGGQSFPTVSPGSSNMSSTSGDAHEQTSDHDHSGSLVRKRGQQHVTDISNKRQKYIPLTTVA